MALGWRCRPGVFSCFPAENPMKSVLAVSIGLMFCSGAAAQPTTRATVETIVADMKNMNDFPLKGYETFSSGWYVGRATT
jgi:hypothetical protein